MKRVGSGIWFVVCCLSLSCNRPPTNAGAPSASNTSHDPAPTVVLDNGLEIQEIALGAEQAPVASRGHVVAINYTGWLEDGKTVIDSTHGRAPLQFQLGEGTVLKGWDLGIPGMRLGGKRRLKLPPALAFGSREFGAVKPDSTLVFEVELVKVQ